MKCLAGLLIDVDVVMVVCILACRILDFGCPILCWGPMWDKRRTMDTTLLFFIVLYDTLDSDSMVPVSASIEAGYFYL